MIRRPPRSTLFPTRRSSDLFKNNTDSAGNSYGCHENYLVARHGEFSRLAGILIPFLVTPPLLCGAGKGLQTPRGARSGERRGGEEGRTRGAPDPLKKKKREK